MPSVCNLCFKQSKTSQHLIFDFTYAMNIWRWLSNVLNSPSTISSLDVVLAALNKSYSPQCKTVVLSAVINTVNSIWFARNQIRFNISKIHWRFSISSIIAQVNLSGNLTHKVSSSAIADFVILKTFDVTIHHPKPPDIIEVMWQPRIFEWVKCNSDRAAVGLNGLAACGGLFRNMNADHLGSFVVNIDNGNALKAELIGPKYLGKIMVGN